MKKEILRVNNLNYSYKETRKLENISLCILEGECVGFFGLTYSGKNLFVRMINGDVEDADGKFSVYIDGRQVTGNKCLKEQVYHITAGNYMIGGWSVAEYVGLVDEGWIRALFHGKALEREVKEYFLTLGIQCDVSRKMRELSELEKRIVDMVKALKKGSCLVIIEDEFEGMDEKDIVRFSEVMKQLIKGRMSVIINSHSNMIMRLLSDRYVIFYNGRIVKKCSKSYIRDTEHLESFLLGGEKLSVQNKPEDLEYAQSGYEDSVYRINGLRIRKDQRTDVVFRRGEIVTFLVLNAKEKERLFLLVSGRTAETDMKYVVEKRGYSSVTPELLAGEKIVSVKYMGGREELFAKMTVEENLLLPSLRKLSSIEYIISSGKIIKMAAETLQKGAGSQKKAADHLKTNDRISLIMERWLLYNPKVLILFEPFVMCDAFGVSLVKDYIKRFAGRGTAVIIFKSREEYIEDISDKIIRI